MISSKKSVPASLLGLLPLALRVSAQDTPTLPVVVPELTREQVWTGLDANLFAPGSTNADWDAGWTFQGCYDLATERGYNPADFEVFDVYYDDCGEPWAMCRHVDVVSPSRDEMIDMFGKMPVRSRDFIKHVIVMPDLNGAAGLFVNYNIAFGEGYMDSYVVAHEVSHSLDYAALTDYGWPFSETSYWTDAYWQDSASPTAYAQTSWVENFGEAGPLGFYDTVVPEGIEAIQPSWGQIYNQYETWKAYLGDVVIPGGECVSRMENDAVVAMTTSAKAAGPKPKGGFKTNVAAKQNVPEAPKIVDQHIH